MNQKQIVRSLLSEAKQELAAVRTVEAELLDKRMILLERAWRLGRILARLREQISRGNWQVWLCANFPELGVSDRARVDNARCGMAFYHANEPYENSRTFDADSQRKSLWNYIPARQLRVYDEASNVIETHEHKGGFKEW